MTITAYYPLVYVNDLDGALEEFVKIGFKHLHSVNDGKVRLHVLELNGNRMDIYTSELPELRVKEGIYAMHVNVKDFEEGLQYFMGQGYKILMGPRTSSSSKLAVMEDDQERRVFLFHHIKEEA